MKRWKSLHHHTSLSTPRNLSPWRLMQKAYLLANTQLNRAKLYTSITITVHCFQNQHLRIYLLTKSRERQRRQGLRLRQTDSPLRNCSAKPQTSTNSARTNNFRYDRYIRVSHLVPQNGRRPPRQQIPLGLIKEVLEIRRRRLRFSGVCSTHAMEKNDHMDGNEHDVS